MTKSDKKIKRKLTKNVELMLWAVAITLFYWSYHDIISGSTEGKRSTYYFKDTPIMFLIILFTKLYLGGLSVYNIVKSRLLRGK